jgi:exosortase
MKKTTLAAGFLALLTFGILYQHVIAKLVNDWYIDDNYSHGFLIIPLAAFFAWERRARLRAAVLSPSIWGIPVIGASLFLLAAGYLGSELFVTRVSLLGCIAGTVLFLGGWNPLKVLLFPISFLLLMIPIPSIIFNQIAFPLQLLASRFGEMTLVLFQIPVLREGNVIHLANTSLEVADACSGIRSLISLLTLGIIYGYFSDSRIWLRVSLAVATVPIAIAANGIRVAGTGVAAHYYGAAAAEGFFHSFSGWIIFLAAFILMFAFHRILLMVFPAKAEQPKQQVHSNQS